MAPVKKSTKASNGPKPARASGSGKKKVTAATSGLFFGGTEHVQQSDEDEYEEEEQTGLHDSDADEDAEYEETTTRKKQRTSSKKAGKQTSKTFAPKTADSDYGSDDEVIVTLKTKGYKDDAIAKKLAEKGSHGYSAKRVSARWTSKLRKIEELKRDQRLDDEQGDWHIGEDEKLRECFNAAEAKYEVELMKLKERKWKEVATTLAEALGEKKYTAKACKERWEGLEDGTALIPIELDHDQAGRKILCEARIAERKRIRAEEKAQREWEAGAKDRKKAEERAEKAEKDRERQAERDAKQAEREVEQRIKVEQREGRSQKHAEQVAIMDDIKRMHRAKRTERKNADAINIYLTGYKLNGRKDKNLINGGGSDGETDASDSDGEEDDEIDLDLTDAEETSDEEVPSSKPANGMRRSARVSGGKPKVKVTFETLANPRTIMNDGELADVLARRGLNRRAAGEPHAEVVARIAAADAAASVETLRGFLANYFDRRKGTHAVLVRRLQEYDAAQSERGVAGVTATDPEFKEKYEGYTGKFALRMEE